MKLLKASLKISLQSNSTLDRSLLVCDGPNCFINSTQTPQQLSPIAPKRMLTNGDDRNAKHTYSKTECVKSY